MKDEQQQTCNTPDGDWHYAEEIRVRSDVDAALGKLLKDATADAATALIREVIRVVKEQSESISEQLKQCQAQLAEVKKELAEEEATNEYNYTNLDHISSFLVMHDALEIVCEDNDDPLGAAKNVIASFQKIRQRRQSPHPYQALYQWFKDGVVTRQGVTLNKLERKIDKSESKNLLSFSFFGTPEELDSVISKALPPVEEPVPGFSDSMEKPNGFSQRKATYLRNQGYVDYPVAAVLRKGKQLCIVSSSGAVRWLGKSNTTHYPQSQVKASGQPLPPDFYTHQQSWRRALVIAEQQAKVCPPDMDDKAYWQHEIKAFDEAFSQLPLR